jgi:uncharacterized protein YecA (UPF0149 family)
MVNHRLKSQILEVVNNQLRDKDPECTIETFNRLLNLGYSEEEAKDMIAAVLIEEMYYVLKNQENYDQERYSEKLSKLPEYLTDQSGDYDSEEIVQVPIIKNNTIGRNEPCPCGSGKKYKKCCGK